jgi:hypothetical protein
MNKNSLERYSVDELKEKTGLDHLGLKRRLDWWCNKGLLVPGPPDEITLDDTFCLTNSKADIERLAKQVELILM